MIKFFVFLFLSIIFSTSTIAKTVNWKFETSSQNKNMMECINVVDVKSKRSAIAALSNMGMYTETPFIVRIQNNCKETIQGMFKIKLLDKDGFMLEDTLQEFKVGRKGIKKITFEYLISSLKWRKVKSTSLDFEFDIFNTKEFNDLIKELDEVTYGSDKWKAIKELIYGN